MKTTQYSTEGRTLHVTGSLWSGDKCKHSYALKDGQQVNTLADAKRVAGDFESIKSARVETVTRQVTETTRAQRLTA